MSSEPKLRADAPPNGLWVTWEIQRRNRGLSAALQWPLLEISGRRGARYVSSALATVRAIREGRPRIVVAQNPSIVLAVLTVALGRVLGYRAVIDAHNGGIFPGEGQSRVLMGIARWLQRHADLTVVTNDQLLAEVEGNGGRAHVLPDRLPRIPAVHPVPRDDRGAIVVFICTYSADEPYREVFEAARLLPEEVIVQVTGRPPRTVDPATLPPNVRVTGFLPEVRFWELLSSADVIMDLTLREGCLVCGAYESVALGTPLVLSDTRALRGYFSRGAVYVAPTPAAIAAGIGEAVAARDSLRLGIERLRGELEAGWEDSFRAFIARLRQLAEGR